MAVAPEIGISVAESVKRLPQMPGSHGVQCMLGSEPVYLFWLMADDAVGDTPPFVVVAISFRQGNDGEQRSFSFVHGLVKPALECLRRELLARNEILNLHSSLAEQDNDLEMLLSVSGGGPDAKPESATDLKDIVASATEHLKVGLAALIIPERGIAVVHASAEAPLDTSLLAKAHRHLLSMAQVRRGAAIVNRMVLQTGAAGAAEVSLSRAGLSHRARGWPLRRRAGVVPRRKRARVHAAPFAPDRTAGAPRGRGARPQL